MSEGDDWVSLKEERSFVLVNYQSCNDGTPVFPGVAVLLLISSRPGLVQPRLPGTQVCLDNISGPTDK